MGFSVSIPWSFDGKLVFFETGGSCLEFRIQDGSFSSKKRDSAGSVAWFLRNAWETPLANSGVSYSYPTWREPIRKDDAGMFLIEPEPRLAFGTFCPLFTVCNTLDSMPDAYGKTAITNFSHSILASAAKPSLS